MLSILCITNNLERFSGQWDASNRLHAATRKFDLALACLGASIPNSMPLRCRFDKLLKDAGLPYMRFHDLRHSVATILLSMGGPAKVVQEILRHGNISTTLNTYAHVLSEMHRDAMEKMDTFLRGER